MPIAEVNGIDVAYEIRGEGEPLLLIMGLGGQLTDWPVGFVDKLAERFTVILFDNRDSGLSSYSDAPVPSHRELFKASLRPAKAAPPYRLRDMADDAHALVQFLGHDRVHVVGMSMGGMIAQLFAIHYPASVRSLCSIMSNPGDKKSGKPTLKVLKALSGRDESTREGAIDVTIELFKLVGGRDWDVDEHRERTTASIERAYNPGGVLRQSLAIAATPDRTKQLGELQMPVLVVHGLDDTLVRPSGGVATARAIPHSRLLMFPRMGHDISATRHDEIVEGIVRNAARAEVASAPASRAAS